MNDDDVSTPRRTVRVPRSRGAVSGLLLIVLGAWGALIPFIGPYFDFAYTPDTSWTWTSARFWLEVLPGVAAALAGLLLLRSGNRVTAVFWAWLAAAAGAWFVVGQSFAPLLRVGELGGPVGTGNALRTAESLGFFYGIGALILFIASTAAGRLSVTSVRDVELARQRAVDRKYEDSLRREVEQRREISDNAAVDNVPDHAASPREVTPASSVPDSGAAEPARVVTPEPAPDATPPEVPARLHSDLAGPLTSPAASPDKPTAGSTRL